jgi:hypothetical protein
MSVTFAQRGRPPPNPAQIQKVKKMIIYLYTLFKKKKEMQYCITYN